MQLIASTVHTAMKNLYLLILLLLAYSSNTFAQTVSHNTSLFKQENPLSYNINFTAPVNFTNNNFAFSVGDEKRLLRKGNVKLAFGAFVLTTSVIWAGFTTALGVGLHAAPPYGLFVFGTTAALLAIGLPLTIFGARERRQYFTINFEDERLLLLKGNIKLGFGIFVLTTSVVWYGIATAFYEIEPPYGLFVVGTTAGMLAIGLPLTIFGVKQRKKAKAMQAERLEKENQPISY